MIRYFLVSNVQKDKGQAELPPIENNPVITNKINELWENVTTVDTFFAKRDPTDEECEQAAQV